SPSAVSPLSLHAALPIFAITSVFLFVTGHRGGVLTHGDNYLWEGLPVAWQQFLGHDPYEAEKLEFDISSLDSALVYEDIIAPIRSEEHTSELQSRENLVC